jgi:hypothetical protein
MPGFSDARIYPLDGPDLRKARALARGRTRGGKALLYVIAPPPQFDLLDAQIVKANLAKVGLHVMIKQFLVDECVRQKKLEALPSTLPLTTGPGTGSIRMPS